MEGEQTVQELPVELPPDVMPDENLVDKTNETNPDQNQDLSKKKEDSESSSGIDSNLDTELINEMSMDLPPEDELPIDNVSESLPNNVKESNNIENSQENVADVEGKESISNEIVDESINQKQDLNSIQPIETDKQTDEGLSKDDKISRHGILTIGT